MTTTPRKSTGKTKNTPQVMARLLEYRAKKIADRISAIEVIAELSRESVVERGFGAGREPLNERQEEILLRTSERLCRELHDELLVIVGHEDMLLLDAWDYFKACEEVRQ